MDPSPLLSTSEGKRSFNFEKNEEKLIKKILRLFSTCTYRYPYVNFIISFTILSYYTLIFALKYGLKVPANIYNYKVTNGDITNKWLSLHYASNSTFNSYLDLMQKNLPYPQQMNIDQIGAIIYEVDDGDILTVPRIQEMWKFERIIHDLPGFEDVCFKLRRDNVPNFLRQILNMVISANDLGIGIVEENGCIEFRSIPMELRKIMMRQFNISNPRAEDLTQEHLDYLLETDFLRIKLTYLGTDVKNNKTSRCRCLVTSGTPVKGFRNRKDRIEEQRKVLGEWQTKILKPAQEFQSRKPLGIMAYPNFPYTVDAQVGPIVLTQIPLFAGVFVATIIVIAVYTKSFFITIFGFIGTLLPIPCAICSVLHVLGIESLDTLDFCILLLIPVFETCYVLRMTKIYEESSFQIPFDEKEERLLHTLKETINGIIVSIIVTTAGTFACVFCNFKITVFYGLCLIMFQLFSIVFIIFYFFTILAIYSKYFEKVGSFSDQINHNDSLSVLDLSTIDFNGVQIKRFSLFDFLKTTPPFGENHAMINMSKVNKIQRLVLNYFAPFLYHYRLVGFIIFIVLTVVFTLFGLEIDYKTDFKFFKENDNFQRGLDLTATGFHTYLFDFSFVYIWGIKPTLTKKWSYWRSLSKYGEQDYFDINISSEGCQQFMLDMWDRFLKNDYIEPFLAENVGGSPFTVLKALTDFNYTINASIPVPIIGPVPFVYTINSTHFDNFLRIVSDVIGFDVSDLDIPDSLPMSQEMFEKAETQHLFRLLTSQYLYKEADGYIPGSLLQNVIGFDDITMKLKYIGFKGNYLPIDIDNYTYEHLSEIKRKSDEFAQTINYQASVQCPQLHDKGFFTSSALLQLEVWNNILYELLLVGFLSILFSTIAYFALTWSWSTSIMYAIIGISSFFHVLGIVHIAKFKYNVNTQAIICLFLPFIGQLYIQPLLRIKDNYRMALSTYGQVQLSIVQAVVEMSLLCILSTVTGAIMIFSKVLIFTPLALIFLTGIFAYVQGLFVVPFLYTLFFPYNQNVEEKYGSISGKSDKSSYD